ncbi:MAG: efflux RND transporter periplasmic adaptor subunit [Usitatibacter sp.]
MTLSRRARIIIAVAAAVLTAAAGGWRLVTGPAVAAYPVERADLVQTVVASGRVESPRRVEIGVQLTGTVASIPVVEGQSVKKGQLLIALDDSEAKAAAEEARFAVQQADEKLRQVRSTGLPVAKEAVRQAEANLVNAQRGYERSRDLFARGFVGQAALDEALRARDVAQSQLASAQLQRDSESAGGADYRAAEAALGQARANLRVASARLEFMTVEAPVDGVLIARNVEAGSVVQPGRALMVLSPAGETQLVVQIDEKNLALLKLGQDALASADAYPGQRFAAQVAYINPGIDPLRGSVEVKLRVPQPPDNLIQDMTVSVDIEVARRASVLTLAADAVRDGATPTPWVLVARAGRAMRQPIRIGARGDGVVEVAEGLVEGELVVPATQAAVGEGKPLRAAAMNSRSAKRT